MRHGAVAPSPAPTRAACPHDPSRERRDRVSARPGFGFPGPRRFVAAVYRDRVLDHLALQVADVDAAAAFYIEVFAPLGVRELMRLSREEGTVVG